MIPPITPKNDVGRKALGPDRININTLKILNKKYPSILDDLFSACYRECYFPRAWKTGNVVLIPKLGKDASRTEGCRPITLLSALGKVYERLIKNRLEAFIEQHGQLCDRQFGSRKGRSCEEALNHAVDAIRRTHQAKKITTVLSLDIKGAFDHARWILIKKKCIKLGVPWFLVRSIISFFTDRFVTLGGILCTIDHECPQGSALGPLLWLIFFEDIMYVLEADSETKFEMTLVQCFVDDTLMVLGSNTADEFQAGTHAATTAV